MKPYEKRRARWYVLCNTKLCVNGSHFDKKEFPREKGDPKRKNDEKEKSV
jgi:hypothetical protein